ncbi:MAG: hypothetical protein EBU08_23020 [Micrococcales bacterium]|nr:hypothetical protein [Micrococcales bacterium]
METSGYIPKNLRSSNRDSQLLEEISSLMKENEILAESYSAMARATIEFDDVGWSPVNQLNEQGDHQFHDLDAPRMFAQPRQNFPGVPRSLGSE